MEWEPPNGLENFVRVVQAATPADAADLLRLAFANAAADAVFADYRLRTAAPALLAACRLALAAFERNEAIDWNELTRAIATADRPETPIA